MSKEITFDEDAWKRIQIGVDKLANAVKVTIGPGGSTVILERLGGGQHLTKDGVTVSREITLEDPLENIGAMIIKEAANKTAELAGDGTSCSTILAQAIFKSGVKMVLAGANRMDIKNGIDIAVKAVVEQLKVISQPVTEGDVLKIATISANGDTVIGELINEAIGKVGREGIVTVEDTKSIESSVKAVEGMRFDRGYLSPYFITDQQKMEVEFRNCEVLIYDGIITTFKELIPILDKIRQRGVLYPLVIIAEDIQGEALANLAMNHQQGNGSFCAVQSPDMGDSRKETLKDIAALTGATIIAKETGISLNTADEAVLGKAEKIRITQWNTSIIGGAGPREAVEGRILTIKEQMKDANPQAMYQLKDRLARLVNGMAVIYVGGTTDVEIREKKDRIDDALQATRAALEEGVVVGGGVAYIKAVEKVKSTYTGDVQIGIELLLSALKEPLQAIATNAGQNGEMTYLNVKKNADPNWGFNAKSLVYCDLLLAGVIDPTKVTRLALENAASVAGMLLTTRAVISNVKPK